MPVNLIKQLGLEKCKQIVDGAPKHAEYYSPLSFLNKYKKSVRDNTHEADVASGYTKSYDFWDGRKWNSCACMLEHLDDLVLISSIRAAIADHDRTDFVSDIRNHISPTTVVIERGGYEQ